MAIINLASASMQYEENNKFFGRSFLALLELLTARQRGCTGDLDPPGWQSSCLGEVTNLNDQNCRNPILMLYMSNKSGPDDQSRCLVCQQCYPITSRRGLNQRASICPCNKRAMISCKISSKHILTEHRIWSSCLK